MPPARMVDEGARITKELITHYSKSGAELAAIWAPPGSGKTALLISLASRMAYQVGRRLVKETVIWRGRDEDNWHLIQGRKVCIFIHFLDSVSFVDVTGKELENLTIFRYDTAYDIIANVKRGWVNVVYEPRNYVMDEELLEEIATKQFMDDVPKKVSRSFFIYELIYFFKEYKRSDDYFTFIIDEADEIFRMNAPYPQSRFQQWFKDACLRDMRKNKLSFIITFHDYRELDYGVFFKVTTKVYLPAAVIPPAKYSVIRKKELAMTLNMGSYLIEKKGKFGIAEFDRVDTDNQVRAVWRHSPKPETPEMTVSMSHL